MHVFTTIIHDRPGRTDTENKENWGGSENRGRHTVLRIFSQHFFHSRNKKNSVIK